METSASTSSANDNGSKVTRILYRAPMTSLQFGYRCTVDGVVASEHRGNVVLEQEFAWLCATCCRKMVQVPSSRKNVKKLLASERETHELVKRHGTLMKKGLNLQRIPSLPEILRGQDLKVRISPGNQLVRGRPAISNAFLELSFVRDFMDAGEHTPGGSLARALPTPPYVDVSVSHLEVQQSLFVGTPAEVVKFLLAWLSLAICR